MLARIQDTNTAVQAKLEVGKEDDSFEQEANTVADKVMRMSSGDDATAKMTDGNKALRMMKDEEEEEGAGITMMADHKTQVQKMTDSNSGGMEAPAHVEQGILSSQGKGNSMDMNVQQELGSKMGTDLSGVGIHTDSNAIQMSKDLGAKAFTSGQDIYFNQNQYNPSSSTGKHLLAHELTHTLQQGNGLQRKIQRETIGDEEWLTAHKFVQELQKNKGLSFDPAAGEKAASALKLYYQKKLFLTASDIGLIMLQLSFLVDCPTSAKMYLMFILLDMDGFDLYTAVNRSLLPPGKLSLLAGPSIMERYNKLSILDYSLLTQRFYDQYQTNAPLEESFATLNSLEMDPDKQSVFRGVFYAKFNLSYTDLLDIRVAGESSGKQEYARQLSGRGTAYTQPLSGAVVSGSGIVVPFSTVQANFSQSIFELTRALDTADAPVMYSILTGINRNPYGANLINYFELYAPYYRGVITPIDKEEKKSWRPFIRWLNKQFPGIPWITKDIPYDLAAWNPDPSVLPPAGVPAAKADLKRLFEDYKVQNPYYPQVESFADEVRKSGLKPEEQDYVLHLMTESNMINEKDSDVASKQTEEVVKYIEEQARIMANVTRKIDPGSKFFLALKNNYLKDYLANPTPEEGKKAVGEDGKSGIGQKMMGGNVGPFDPSKPEDVKFDSQSTAPIMIYDPVTRTFRPITPANKHWEGGAIGAWNQQKLSGIKFIPKIGAFKPLKGLPSTLGAATDILRSENLANLPYIDAPFLIGKENPDTSSAWADVMGGGKNLSQLMHWASGVKYAGQGEERLHVLFFLYEMWHLEGWDVFGQDAINDMIAEEQGRILGEELLKGSAGKIKDEASLETFINESFTQARAWVGTLLNYRKDEFTNWTGATSQTRAAQHYNKRDRQYLWASKTAYQMFADGMTMDAVKKSELVQAQIEIAALMEEAKNYTGNIKITKLEEALLKGKFKRILAFSAR